MRRLVPPRSTPIEKSGMEKKISSQGNVFNEAFE
jgi:hypothetical protein